MKPKAIITMCLGELYWEIGRFAPYIIYKKKQQPDTKFIIASREDRLDIYGGLADVFIPLRIPNENIYIQDCFRLNNYPDREYHNLIKNIEEQFKDRYEIIENIYPKIDGKNFCDKSQFKPSKMIYEYTPRERNKEVISEQIISNKKIVIIAPRFRKGLKRNWNHWNTLYDLIYSNENLMNRFEFVICGKKPDYIPDEKNRFIDINNFPKDKEISLIGLTIELIKKSVLTIGSQSGIPNISLLLGTPVLEWGNQKQLHTISYNILNTQVTFLDDMKFDLSPEIIIKNMEKLLREK